MLLLSNGNIFQIIALMHGIVDLLPDGPRRKRTCNSLITWPRLLQRSILLNFTKTVKKVETSSWMEPQDI